MCFIFSALNQQQQNKENQAKAVLLSLVATQNAASTELFLGNGKASAKKTRNKSF
jgi:hypothetical protein